MHRDEIEPLVPVMPRDDEDEDETVRADGGRRTRYDDAEVDAPLVPDLR